MSTRPQPRQARGREQTFGVFFLGVSGLRFRPLALAWEDTAQSGPTTPALPSSHRGPDCAPGNRYTPCGQGPQFASSSVILPKRRPRRSGGWLREGPVSHKANEAPHPRGLAAASSRQVDTNGVILTDRPVSTRNDHRQRQIQRLAAIALVRAAYGTRADARLVPPGPQTCPAGCRWCGERLAVVA